MTYTEYAQKKTTRELNKELGELNDMIEKVDCFNCRDLMLRDAIEAELHNRKIKKVRTPAK